MGDSHIFDSPDSIDRLFDTIEDRPELYIDVNDIWLPNHLFKGMPHERGNVYRTEEQLFVEAYSYRQDRISQEQFLISCEELGTNITVSEIETAAFRKWQMHQIERAKDIYDQRPVSENLEWRE